jgi:predicted phosphohydrolase
MTTRKLLVQVYSDIHSETWNEVPVIPVKADYLILAGDISQLNHPLFFRFLDYCSKNWKKTFYIPGNHEYYSHKKNMDELEFEYKYRIGEKYKNIFYLNNSMTKLNDDINIYGTTFWTNPPFSSKYEAKIYVNDYNHIKYFKQGLNEVVNLDVLKVRELSNASFKQLHAYLAGENKKTIVVTHFPPRRTATSHPKYLAEDRIINLYSAWPDDTVSKFKVNNILAWISGHTHWSYDFCHNNIRLISNQLGYESEMEKTGINEDGLYEITVS